MFYCITITELLFVHCCLYFTYRLGLYEFMNNEDVHCLFVSVRSRQLTASLTPPNAFQSNSKSIFFIKKNANIKLTKENLCM